MPQTKPLKYAFMSFSCQDATLDQMLELAKDLGYAAIEPRIEANHAHGIETTLDSKQRAAVRDQVRQSGIVLCALACSSKLAQVDDLQATLDQTRQSIDLCGDLGSSRLRVFGGNRAENLSRDQAIDTLTDSLGQLCEHAAQRDVTLVVETHDDWCDPNDLATVMQRVDHPHVGVNWDPYHPARKHGWDMAAQWQTLGQWVYHAHVHDGENVPNQPQLMPMGTGEVDHRPVIQILRDAQFPGYLSVEYPTKDPARPLLAHEIQTMQSYEQPS